MTERALQAADMLGAARYRAAVLHASSLKPFDSAAVRDLAARVPAIFSVENGTVIGGLGSAVAEALAASAPARR